MNQEGLQLPKMMKENIRNKIVDYCFIKSLKDLKKNAYVTLSLQLLQFIVMAMMIPINLIVSKDTNQQVFIYFIAASCVTFFNMSLTISKIACYLSDASLIKNIAQQLNHVVDITGEQSHPTQSYSDIVYSQIVYNVQTNLTMAQANQTMRRIVEPQLSNMIRIMILSKNSFLKAFGFLGSCCSLGLFIYAIVIMSTQQLKTLQLVVMIIFCISEILLQPKIFAIVILIALIPLICIFLCFYCCCCSQKEKEANLPQAKQATIQIIEKADASPCSICFQNMELKEMVIILPCSQKHLFHSNCIKSWTQFKNTCPICRYDLSQ